MRYDPQNNTYTYLDGASFLTNIFDTFKDPIPNKPVTLVRQLSDEVKTKKARK
jgi:hypothetical protein